MAQTIRLLSYQAQIRSSDLDCIGDKTLKKGPDKDADDRLPPSGRSENSIDPHLYLYSPRRRSAGSDLG